MVKQIKKLGAIILSIMAFSCTETEPEVIHVSSISLNPTSITLTEGQTATISATISPSNSSNQKVIWSSSDATIATVSDGTVVAIAEGTAVISAFSDDGGKNATCSVSVKSKNISGGNEGELNALDIDVLNISNTSCSISVSSNSSKTYFWEVSKKAMWDQYGSDEIWETYISEYKKAGKLAEAIFTGNSSFTVEELSENTEYIVFAAFCDKNGVKSGEIYTKSFKTTSGDNTGGGSENHALPSKINTNVTLTINNGEHVENFNSSESFIYDRNGQISRYTTATAEGKTTGRYSYSYSGSVVTETEDIANEDVSLVFVDGCVTRWLEHVSITSYNTHNHTYKNGYLTLEEIVDPDEAEYLDYIWEDSCLSKITKRYSNLGVYAEYEFVYGKDKNPYYGLNFEPTSLWLSPSSDDVERWKKLGLMGKNSKKLPIEVKYLVAGECETSYSIKYEFASGTLKEIIVTEKAADYTATSTFTIQH